MARLPKQKYYTAIIERTVAIKGNNWNNRKTAEEQMYQPLRKLNRLMLERLTMHINTMCATAGNKSQLTPNNYSKTKIAAQKRRERV